MDSNNNWLQDENSIEINSVSEYIKNINEILSKEENGTLFFRGQEDEKSPIKPSIFRDDLLSREHSLLSEPLIKTPYDFKSLEKIEILAKYQHYGLPTRLLDITTNPLVALYFACSKKNPAETCGKIYFRRDYPIKQNAKEINIILSLAEKELTKENTLENILSFLQKECIISDDDKKKFEEINSDFPTIIQRSYTILPPNTNERMKMQSGAFLLASCFNFTESLRWKDSSIRKGHADLRNLFDKQSFYVTTENQEKILEDLNLYNINESTLFPELEHQLNYIKMTNMKKCVSVSTFEKYKSKNKYEIKGNDNSIVQEIRLNSNDINAVLRKQKIAETLHPELQSLILQQTKIIDWDKKDSSKSKLIIDIAKFLNKHGFDKDNAKQRALRILDELLKLL